MTEELPFMKLTGTLFSHGPIFQLLPPSIVVIIGMKYLNIFIIAEDGQLCKESFLKRQ